ncbi:recombinase family protein [Streptomyces sp. NPDC050535]|uniref:recombinase family protein n=1 Tax=Streptomyces sp. NPDC050535 TaxID=3365626 RepID=UPI00379E8BB3
MPRLPPSRCTLVVPSLDRYGRSLQDLVNMVAELRKRETGIAGDHSRGSYMQGRGASTVSI